ncbi:N(4)-(beta-N-acetylglucosaminyl)-L-asparaginase [Gottschalkiaceae bacterium SANA]|nr:N(4)-(beta-N-acetylglucosaminyl)-L-asparaginase [Gottschalkiaceae bacterium SANA]
MKYGMIATWKMAYEGVLEGTEKLRKGKEVSEAVICTVESVENNPAYRSVGFGGLPNRLGQVELDAAYMNGENLSFGAVMAVKNIKNPIRVARHLSQFQRNNLLAGAGAEAFAAVYGYESTKLLTKESRQRWKDKVEAGFMAEKIEAYDGHDTVCVIGLDNRGRMGNGVSTSGLFMKQPGRVGDSPVIGSGFYCDSRVGAASATGVGEDIMKGCLSYQIVSLIKAGVNCQAACENVLFEHEADLKGRGIQPGSMSVIAMDKNGNFGGATTQKEFPFVVSREEMEATIFVAQNDGKVHRVIKATKEWKDNYLGD